MPPPVIARASERVPRALLLIDATLPPQPLPRSGARDRPHRPAHRPRHLAPARRIRRDAGWSLVGTRPRIVERYELHGSGIVDVLIQNVDTGYERAYRLGA